MMNYELRRAVREARGHAPLSSLEMTRPPREKGGAFSGGAAAAESLFTLTVCAVIPNAVRNLVAVCGLLCFASQ